MRGSRAPPLRPLGQKEPEVDILFVLVPLSVLMALAIIFGLWWAVERGQFDDIEREGSRILGND